MQWKSPFSAEIRHALMHCDKCLRTWLQMCIYTQRLRVARSLTVHPGWGCPWPQQFGNALRAYLDSPVADALISKDPFVRALAMIDNCAGRERLRKHKPKK